MLLSMLVLALQALQPACGQPASEEYKVKAAFLFHFAQLVDWPPGALNANDQTLNVCVFEDEPHRQELQSTLEGKQIGSRVVRLVLLGQPQHAQGCDVLFLSRDEERRQNTILKSLRGQPVLTVGETDNFLSSGGMIRLHLEEDKIRFDVNTGSADICHLKISARLLLLATSVKLTDGMKGEQ